ncbi:OmpA family protein [Micromonospora fluostatini]|uniref:OmpA family protein n=1 Tax=Micromonospora fluostatini TaxID=1629071 RepID=A0ABY2DJG9_9ACTN|nr:OmpA family protein [Micromonospora fluostatini]
MIRKTLAGAAAVALTFTVAGCGDDAAPDDAVTSSLTCPSATGGAVTLVVGARGNTPQPDLPTEILDLVRVAAKSGRKIHVIRVDGQPSVALAATFRSEEKNDARNARNLDNFVTQTLAVVQRLQPKVAEADGLAALAEAGRVTPAGGTVVFIDSGLPTTGPLSFTNVAMFGAEPADVSAFLTAEELMPKLSDRAVVFVGVGNTADPQPELNEKLRKRVTAIWHTVVKDAGATCVEDLPTASRRTAVDYPVPVSVVALPKPVQFGRCGTTVLADSDSVGFVVGTARLREPEEGRKVLRQLADQLSTGGQRVLLVGVTSSEGRRARNEELSRQRAAAIKAELVNLGIDAERIRTRGDGPGGRYFRNDRNRDGALVPSAAARNRAVVVELTCPTS